MILYRYFRWLSLDIVLGAVIFLGFLGSLYELMIPASVYLALAITVWLIYSVDHLIDSRNIRTSDPRRVFHQKYFKQVVFFAGIVSVVGLINVYYLPVEIIRAGAILAACCILYLMLVYFLPGLWLKELLVAIGYASGIFLTPISLLDSLQTIDFILFTQLAVLALVNLLVFSVYDRESDIKNGFGSITCLLGAGSVSLIWALLSLLIGSSVYLGVVLAEKYQIIQFVYLIMTCILVGVMRFQPFFGQNERFRVVGDAIFFVPAIFLFF
tara:strand:- start:4631 stop:5437 length:807 start_codon:yes stop_codon:yes gene_type:complete